MSKQHGYAGKPTNIKLKGKDFFKIKLIITQFCLYLLKKENLHCHRTSRNRNKLSAVGASLKLNEFKTKVL